MFIISNSERINRYNSYEVPQRDLIDEVKKKIFFNILTDDVESRHVEQLPICVRFANKSNDIRDEFLEFERCTQVNGEVISKRFFELEK